MSHAPFGGMALELGFDAWAWPAAVLGQGQGGLGWLGGDIQKPRVFVLEELPHPEGVVVALVVAAGFVAWQLSSLASGRSKLIVRDGNTHVRQVRDTRSRTVQA